MTKKREIEVGFRTKVYWDSDEENKDIAVESRTIYIQQDNTDYSAVIDIQVKNVDKLIKALQKAKKTNQWEFIKIRKSK